jgi:hypothetical protein
VNALYAPLFSFSICNAELHFHRIKIAFNAIPYNPHLLGFLNLRMIMRNEVKEEKIKNKVNGVTFN